MIYNDLSEHIDHALELGVDGLTINMHDDSFSKEEIERAKSNNLNIQLWTISNEEQLDTALKYKPYAIQLSNLELIRSYADSTHLKIENQPPY